MFFGCDPLEGIRIRKYYSRARKCPQCKNIGYLNCIVGLCNSCTKVFLESLRKEIKYKM